MIDEIAALALGVNTETDAREVFRFDLRDDRSHAVVRPRSTGRPDANPAERQVDVVVDDDEILRLQAVALQQAPHRMTAVVHERSGSRNGDAQRAKRSFGDAGISGLRLEFGTHPFREAASDLVADVMARAGVLLAGIAQPDDESIRLRRFATREEAHRSSGDAKNGHTSSVGPPSLG